MSWPTDKAPLLPEHPAMGWCCGSSSLSTRKDNGPSQVLMAKTLWLLNHHEANNCDKETVKLKRKCPSLPFLLHMSVLQPGNQAAEM